MNMKTIFDGERTPRVLVSDYKDLLPAFTVVVDGKLVAKVTSPEASDAVIRLLTTK